MKKEIERVKLNNDLNSLQWKIHNYLINQDGLVQLKDIYNEFKVFYPVYDSKKSTWANSSARRMITEDLNKIANSLITHKVLIRSSAGIGYADESTTMNYLNSEFVELAQRWKTYQLQIKKSSLNNQMRLTFAGEKEIWEAFKDGSK